MWGPASPSLFVGRLPEIERLRLAFAAARDGHGGLALVAGEPGIGKSTLCRSLMAWAVEHGALPIVGHCDDAGQLPLPYLPFVDALQDALRARDPISLIQELGSQAADLAQVVPAIRDHLPAQPTPSRSTDPADARYRLLRAVTAALVSLAATCPILLVLEDLQDADRGTLDMLGHLSRHLTGAHILVVGTYRSTEVDRAHPLTQTIATMRRHVPVDRLGLTGLTQREVQHLVNGIAERALSPTVTAFVYAQTEGNPLFVWEVMRQRLQAEAPGRAPESRPSGLTPWEQADVPDGLVDVIGTRINRLSPACQRLLAIAAVIGRDFSAATVQAVSGEPGPAVAAALGEAVRAALLHGRSEVGGVQYRFAHALFRQTLAADLSAAERTLLHPQVARVLETTYGPDDGEHAAALAEHFGQSTAPEDLQKALVYSQRAAAYATAVFASAEAARLLGHALAIQAIVAPTDLALRCDLLTGRGQALLDAGEPRRVLDDLAPAAFALAERLQDADRASAVCQLAMASLNSERSTMSLATPEAALWVRRADTWARPGTLSRVRADIALGTHGYFRGAAYDGVPILTRALTLARQLDDPEALWWAYWTWLGFAQAPQHTEAQLRLAEEVLARPRTGVSTRTLALGLSWLGAAFLSHGQRARAELAWHELDTLAARSGQPMVQILAWRGPTIWASLDGRLNEAADIGDRLLAYGAETGLLGFALVGAALAVLRALLHLGRFDEAERLAVNAGSLPIRLLVSAYRGRIDEVRAHLDEHVLQRANFGTDRDETHEFLDVLRLEAAVLIGHREAAARLVDRLAPLHHATTGVRLTTCVARHLGAAAALLGRTDDALSFYQSALALGQEMRFRPEGALARLGIAELIVQAVPGRQVEAVEHLALALPELRAMGMASAFARAQALAERLAHQRALLRHRVHPDTLTRREIEVLRLVACGKSNAEIAEALVVSIRTAERHLANIYAKLGTGGPTARAVVTAYAHTHGLAAHAQA